MERFLALEAAGWKGSRGTALLLDSRAVTFARSMARLMAKQDRIRIDALALDGSTLAMAVTLTCGARSFLWKMAYDENFAVHSPGAQLIAALSRPATLDPRVELIDSCASADNPMIYRMWKDRLVLADLFLGCGSDRAASFDAAIARERSRRTLMARAKTAYKAARRGKR
jgi:hypothetical protein